MSDIIDEANATADLFLEAALLKQRSRAIKELPTGVGICLNCSEDVPGDRRWCCPECRDEWQARHR